MATATNTVTALDRIDDAIAAVEEARELLAPGTALTGPHPNHEGLAGQVLDDLRVFRGRVAEHG